MHLNIKIKLITIYWNYLRINLILFASTKIATSFTRKFEQTEIPKKN